jgi:hypothetical protein
MQPTEVQKRLQVKMIPPMARVAIKGAQSSDVKGFSVGTNIVLTCICNKNVLHAQNRILTEM